MNNLILSADTILPVNTDPLFQSAVAISGGKIKETGNTSALTKKFRNYKHVRLGRGILLPGFINAHTHLELGWIQPYIGNFSSFTEWLCQIIIAKRNQELSKEILQKSVREGLSILIRSGVTTVAEISSFEGADIPVIKNSGVRSIIYEELFDKDIEQIPDKLYEKNGLIETRPFPHAPYSCSPELLKRVFKLARKSGVKPGIHLAESTDETDFIKRKPNSFEEKIFPLIGKDNFKRPRGKSPVEYLSRFNKNLEVGTTIIHGVQLTRKELSIIKKQPVGVILCPRSNLFLKVGIPPLRSLIKLKRLGLGTDGLSSNYNLDFFEELRSLHLLLSSFMGKEASYQTLYTATLGGARALFVEDETGSIEKGKAADLIFISYDRKPSDPYMHVLFSGKEKLSMNMINGRIIWSKGDYLNYINA